MGEEGIAGVLSFIGVKVNTSTYIGIRKEVTQHLYKFFSQMPKRKEKKNTCKMVRTCTLIIHTFD